MLLGLGHSPALRFCKHGLLAGGVSRLFGGKGLGRAEVR
jgi:hypothetical protein